MSRRSLSSPRLPNVPAVLAATPDAQPDARSDALPTAGDPTSSKGKPGGKPTRRQRASKRQQRPESDRAMPSSSSSDPPVDAAASGDTEDPSAPTLRSLREWRIVKGMTQQQVAFAAGLAINTVRDIERERQAPSIVTARKLVRALGITLEQVRWPE